MKRKAGKIIPVFTALLLVFMLQPLSAFAATETITVDYKGITVLIDGEEYAFSDENGGAIEPFLYKGTVYVPLRGISEAFGREVAWDGSSYSVYIGAETNTERRNVSGSARKTGSVSLTVSYPGIKILLSGVETALYDASGNRVEPFICGGSVYVPIRGIADALGMEIQWLAATATIVINSPAGETGNTGGQQGSGNQGYGKSAYDLAVENGFKGTVTQWLASLKGSGGSGSTGPQGPQGDPGPAGPAGPAGMGVINDYMSAELISNSAVTVNNGNSIIFNNTGEMSGISYNGATGEITVTSSGIYYISWWAKTGGPTATTYAGFYVTVTGTPEILGSGYSASDGLVSGQGLYSLNDEDVIQIVNGSGGDVTLSGKSPQAGVIVLRLR